MNVEHLSELGDEVLVAFTFADQVDGGFLPQVSQRQFRTRWVN
jgi:hypothetical protein